jgi:DNA-binding NtrC family response regulator
MITGHAEMDTRIRLIQAGAFDCLSEPFTATRLRMLLGRAAQQVHRIRENTDPGAQAEEGA